MSRWWTASVCVCVCVCVYWHRYTRQDTNVEKHQTIEDLCGKPRTDLSLRTSYQYELECTDSFMHGPCIE